MEVRAPWSAHDAASPARRDELGVTRTLRASRRCMLPLVVVLALSVPLALQFPSLRTVCNSSSRPSAQPCTCARAGLYAFAPDDELRLHVALAFHVVRSSAGNDGIAQEQLEAALADADEVFRPGRIVFRLVPLETIDDDALHTIESAEELMRLRSLEVAPAR